VIAAAVAIASAAAPLMCSSTVESAVRAAVVDEGAGETTGSEVVPSVMERAFAGAGRATCSGAGTLGTRALTPLRTKPRCASSSCNQKSNT
jgi:hypothetical protein